MKISAELEWSVAHSCIDMYPSSEFSFRVKENLIYSTHEYVSQVSNATSTLLSTLDVATKYEFQVNMFCEEMMPSLPPSKWSQPLVVMTPSPPKTPPTPTHLQVTMLLPKIMQIKWDPGFAPLPQQKVLYIVKDCLQFSQHQYVAQHSIPIGKLAPLQPDTPYRVTVHTSTNGTESAESKAIRIRTPPANLNQLKDYRPQPPRNIKQSIDNEFNEILLNWSLPPQTWGTNIYYVTLNFPQEGTHQSIKQLPCRIPRPPQDIKIHIITVCELNNARFESQPTRVTLKGGISKDMESRITPSSEEHNDNDDEKSNG